MSLCQGCLRSSDNGSSLCSSCRAKVRERRDGHRDRVAEAFDRLADDLVRAGLPAVAVAANRLRRAIVDALEDRP